MSTYLSWLCWLTANVYFVATLGWTLYRLGYKSGVTQAEREAAVAALAGVSPLPILSKMPLGGCPACGPNSTGFRRKNCNVCAHARIQHLHLECEACGYEFIVKP